MSECSSSSVACSSDKVSSVDKPQEKTISIVVDTCGNDCILWNCTSQNLKVIIPSNKETITSFNINPTDNMKLENANMSNIKPDSTLMVRYSESCISKTTTNVYVYDSIIISPFTKKIKESGEQSYQDNILLCDLSDAYETFKFEYDETKNFTKLTNDTHRIVQYFLNTYSKFHIHYIQFVKDNYGSTELKTMYNTIKNFVNSWKTGMKVQYIIIDTIAYCIDYFRLYLPRINRPRLDTSFFD